MGSIYETFKCRICGWKKNNPSDEDLGICDDCAEEKELNPTPS